MEIDLKKEGGDLKRSAILTVQTLGLAVLSSANLVAKVATMLVTVYNVLFLYGGRGADYLTRTATGDLDLRLFRDKKKRDETEDGTPI